MTLACRERLKPLNPPRVRRRRGAPVAWWLCDRTAGVLPDITDRRRTGVTTLTAGAGVSVTAGPVGPRFAFAGTTGALVTLPGAALSSKVLSMACRFRCDVNPTGINNIDILYAFNGGSVLWGVVVANGPVLRLYNPSFAVQVSTSITLHTEYHLAVTTDGENSRIFLNGAQAAAASSTLTLAGPATSLVLGNYVNGTEPWQGSIDDVRLLDYTPTPSQVMTDYLDPWRHLRPRRRSIVKSPAVFNVIGSTLITPAA